MAEAETTVVETVAEKTNPENWGEMGADERIKYIEGLRDEAGIVAGESPERLRGPDGRFISSNQEQISGEGDDHSARIDADIQPEPKTLEPTIEEPVDWRDAEVQGLAATYGIDAGKLAKIPSREVLDIVLEGLDHKPTAEKPVEGKPAETEKPTDSFAELEAFALGDELSAEDGPVLRKQIQGMVSELKQLRAWQQEQQATASQKWLHDTHSRFVDSLQSLGYEDLYGAKGKTPTKEQAKAIEEAWQEHYDRSVRLEERGGKPDESPAFVKRSALAVHGELILSKIEEKQSRLDRLVAQHNRKTGGGSTKTLPPAAGASPLEKNMARLPQTLRAMGIAGT